MGMEPKGLEHLCQEAPIKFAIGFRQIEFQHHSWGFSFFQGMDSLMDEYDAI